MEQTEIAVATTEEGQPTRRKRVVQALISIAVVVGIFVGVMPQIADYSDVWTTILSLSWLETTTLALVALWNLATYWFVLVAALPGLRLREAAVVNQASTAVSNSLPGGGAIGVGVTLAMLTSWGFRVSAIARSALVTGIWNNFVKLGMPVVFWRKPWVLFRIFNDPSTTVWAFPLAARKSRKRVFHLGLN